MPRPRPDVSVVTSGHDVADARLHREVAALQARGLAVEVLGLGEHRGGPPGAVVRTWHRAGPLGRARLALLLPWLARSRVLVALDPDSAAGCLARRAATGLAGRARRIAVVADVHEDYRSLLRDRAWATGWRRTAARFAAWAGEASARRADLLVVADTHLLPGAGRRVVLLNAPDLSMLPEVAPRDATPRAVYIGDLRASRGLFDMLELLERSPQWSLDLVGPLAPADRERALERISTPSLRERVRWHDRLPPREAWSVAAGAWVGLLLLADTPAFREAVPSKLYEYLATGLAVVATDLPRSAEIVRTSGGGEVVHGVEDAVVVLERWRQDDAQLDSHRERGRAWAADLPQDPAGEFADAVRVLVQRCSGASSS